MIVRHVPLLDLQAQYRSLKPELDAAVMRVAESQRFILGDEVAAFEKEIADYLEVPYALGVSSGTDALLLSLMALGIGPGDEVIVPTFSFFATAGVVSRLHATPVFVDIDPVSFNLDPGFLERAVTTRTRAVVPVHLFGQAADMNAVMEVAEAHGLRVVEDAAQAIGVRCGDGRFAGTVGTTGCFSFFPSKNLGCFGDGGLVVTNDPELYHRMKIMRVHGGEPKYYHKIIGGNFRLDALQAAVLRVKLPHLETWSRRRRENAHRYRSLFIEAGLAEESGRTAFDDRNTVLLPKEVYAGAEPGFYHIYNQYSIRVEKRDKVMQYLRDRNVGCEIYYPVPFHRQECFADVSSSNGSFPVADEVARTILSIPVYPEMTEDMQQYVVETIAEAVHA
ncbi:MAG: DegT/DnrJ/EryC1/StrS family aminotransferase [Chlorobi bacterium]|nr:DegT/DnrJ/EryC1/StrS family aminotransferase [Chlorobiota bacterium]